MKLMLTIIILLFSSFSFADETTTFSVEIPNQSVDLVTASLCASTGNPQDMQNCGADVAKRIVIEFIKEKVDAYVKSQVQPVDINIQ